MKRILLLILAVVLVLSLAACQVSGKPLQTNPPGNAGASKPTCKEPPVLKILDSTGTGIEANTGTYTWSYDNGDGTKSGACADSSHPLEWQKLLLPIKGVSSC